MNDDLGKFSIYAKRCSCADFAERRGEGSLKDWIENKPKTVIIQLFVKDFAVL